jgi:hypothetical protein
MLFVTGLGLINPALLSTTSGITALKTGAASTGAAPGYTIKQHTLYQVWREMFPPDFGWFSAKGVTPVTMTGGTTDPAVSAARADAWRAKVRAAAAASGMPQCPAGAVTDNGASCYYGRGAAGQYVEEADGKIQLLPPGTFHVDGVIFGVSDMVNGRFSKAFKPTATQRKLIEWSVIRRSAQRILGENATRALAPFGGKVSSDGNPSVDTVLARVPEIALFWVNFDRNPIQPTPTERTQPGGWKAWISRGGYPLSREVLTGKVSVSEGALGIEFCSSIMCQCPTSQGKESGTGRAITVGGFPACVPMGFTKDGIGKAENEGSFWPYVAVHQGVNDPIFELTLVHDNPAWITKFGSAAHIWMDKLVGAACTAKQDSSPYAKVMCAFWGIGKYFQGKEGSVDVSMLPPPEALPLPETPSGKTPSGKQSPPSSSALAKYAGCVARFNTTRKVFAIYCPPAPSGLGIFGGFGVDTVVPPVPSTPAGVPFVKTVETPTLPQQGETHVGSEKDKFFRLNNPFMWLAFAGTAAAIGGGGYVIYRRKRAA